MLNATVTITPAFTEGLRGLIAKAGLNAKTVVRKETGELIKTLVRLSLPADQTKTKSSIEGNVNTRIALSDQHGHDLPGNAQGIRWYGVNSNFLRGVAPDLDLRKADIGTVYRTFVKLTPRGRLKLPFKHPRRQQVLISRKVVITPKQQKDVSKRIIGHIGRRAAAWLPAVVKGVINLTGANMPPAKVRRHAANAYGNFMNGLEVPSHPQFTLVNAARGIGERRMAYQIRTAMNIRAKAMKANALLFMKGRKNISDYR